MQLALPDSHDSLPPPVLAPPPPQSRRRPVSAGARIARPTLALHPPASVRGDGRAAEEAETESALGRALDRQRHHRATPVHALPAHPKPVLLLGLAVGDAQTALCVGERWGFAPAAPSLRVRPSFRVPGRAHGGPRAGASARGSLLSRAALASPAGGRACWCSGAATGPASWWAEGVVRARAHPRKGAVLAGRGTGKLGSEGSPE